MFHRGLGGLPIPGRKKKRGLGLTGWLVIGGVFVAVGGGDYLSRTFKSFGGECRVMVKQVGLSTGICNPLGGSMSALNDALPDIGGTSALADFKIPADMRQFTNDLEKLVDTDAFQAAIGPELAKHVDIDAIRDMDGMMGGTLDQALSETQKLSMALSQTALGNGMLSGQFGGGADAGQAIQWHEQGASSGDYGILSQLSLGNIYASGQHTAPDFGRAEGFYAQALQSLEGLQNADTSEASALLSNLPTDPATLKAQLEQQLNHLKGR